MILHGLNVPAKQFVGSSELCHDGKNYFITPNQFHLPNALTLSFEAHIIFLYRCVLSNNLEKIITLRITHKDCKKLIFLFRLMPQKFIPDLPCRNKSRVGV